MKKTFVLSTLILCMALGLAWSATGSSAPTEQQLREMEAQILGPAANPSPAASCTISCFYDPISCTSATGNCDYVGGKGFTWLLCDGKKTFCPNG